MSTTFTALELEGNLTLDPRLALVHRRQRWVAVADLHLGYEFRRRQHGALFPDWGQATVRERLLQLADAYPGYRMILCGDLVDAPSIKLRKILSGLLLELRKSMPEIVLIRGNHDGDFEIDGFRFVDRHVEEDFVFVHGHQQAEERRQGNPVEVRGHLHPSAVLRDGAGTRVKCPAFALETFENRAARWTLPAFSPWAGGVPFNPGPSSDVDWKIFLSAQNRVWPQAGFL